MAISCVSLIISLPSGMALANGGGYVFGLQSTGAVAPVSMEGTEHVAIVEEDLNIDLWSQRAAVTVNYKLLNTMGITSSAMAGG